MLLGALSYTHSASHQFQWATSIGTETAQIISFLLASSFHPSAKFLLDFIPRQIPDAHLRGYSVWPEHGLPQLIQPDGPGVQDTDFLLYVRVAHTAKCHKEVRFQAHPSSLLSLLI